jgi:hypothetical protein
VSVSAATISRFEFVTLGDIVLPGVVVKAHAELPLDRVALLTLSQVFVAVKQWMSSFRGCTRRPGVL